ncbi:hypothetical protein COT72_05010 [archaeon CG10_big_fil_rev_8_21_14_0_10_43_11]|nr:MAG: hypothetical protein COT72_05010 [archaeon CG10_big_fil_rev_8_21_14_0_10_43_11]
MSNKNSLGSRELLENVYSILSEKYLFKTIDFPEEYQNQDPIFAKDPIFGKRPTSVIALDYFDQNKRGYMVYNSINVLKVGNNIWAVGLGELTGENHLIERYTGDIIWLKLELGEKNEEELRTELLRRTRSLASYTDGKLFLPFIRDGYRIFESLKKHNLNEYVVQEAEYNNTRSMKFKPEFAELLANTIESILE